MFAGLVAAAALLFDYMMTVVVSIVAGVFAIGSAFPWANEHKVLLSLIFVGLDHAGEPSRHEGIGHALRDPDLRLRGVDPRVDQRRRRQVPRRVPDRRAVARTRSRPPTAVAGITIFALLKAFSQGATALTGVEAISNGVPAFKRPQARNAATTLAIMGTIAVTMFLGHLLSGDPRARGGRQRGAVRGRADRRRGVRRQLDRLLHRADVHRLDPHPGREHGVPGLPAAGLDPGPGPLHAEPVREPRRPPRVLQRGHRARPVVGADDLRLRCEPEQADPLLRRGGVHLVHACRRAGWSATGSWRAARARTR